MRRYGISRTVGEMRVERELINKNVRVKFEDVGRNRLYDASGIVVNEDNGWLVIQDKDKRLDIPFTCIHDITVLPRVTRKDMELDT